MDYWWYDAQFVKMKTKIETATGNAYLEHFRPTLSQDSRQESGADVLVLGGDVIFVKIFFTRAFLFIPAVQLTITDGTIGLPIALNKTTTGFDVTVVNFSNIRIPAVIDWIATGP